MGPEREAAVPVLCLVLTRVLFLRRTTAEAECTIWHFIRNSVEGRGGRGSE